MRGLKFFQRTSGKHWNIASYHSPHSLTWRWILCITRQSLMWPRPHFIWNSYGLSLGLGQLLHFRIGKDNNGIQWGVALFWIGLSYHSQRPMWFRDMYRRAADERDQLAGRMWCSDRHPHKVRVPSRADVSPEHGTIQ